jgi:hypothetical protein
MKHAKIKSFSLVWPDNHLFAVVSMGQLCNSLKPLPHSPLRPKSIRTRSLGSFIGYAHAHRIQTDFLPTVRLGKHVLLYPPPSD